MFGHSLYERSGLTPGLRGMVLSSESSAPNNALLWSGSADFLIWSTATDYIFWS